MRYFLASLILVSNVALLGAPALRAASPSARQIYAPLWQRPVTDQALCLLTIFLPAQEEKGCVSWTRRESAGPAFHPQIGSVLVGGSDAKLHSFSAKDGALQYEKDLPGALVAQPIFDESAAYFGTDEGHVLRVNVITGDTKWDAEVDAEVTEPAVVSGDIVLVITGLDSVYAFSRQDGSPLWVHKHPLPPGITLRGQARPLVLEKNIEGEKKSLVFVGHATGRMTVLELNSGNVVTEVEVGQGDSFVDVDTDPIHLSGVVVAASQASGIRAFNDANFAKVWELKEPGVVRLAKADDVTLIAAGSKKAMGIDARTGKIMWSFTFEKGAPTRILVKDDRAIFASDLGALFVLNAQTGEPLQYWGSGLGIAADPYIVGDMLLLVTVPGRLFAFSSAFSGIAQK